MPLLHSHFIRLKRARAVDAAPNFASLAAAQGVPGLIHVADANSVTLALDYAKGAAAVAGYELRVWCWNGQEGDSSVNGEGCKFYRDLNATFTQTTEGRVLFSFNALTSWVFVQVFAIDQHAGGNGTLIIDYSLSRSKVG